jgi:4-diphosphocytidyl-2-C-methyl-D-erythritol kinase
MNVSLAKSFSSSSLKLFSPAKLNLFFRVLSKRADGYHEVASLYQAIDFFDLISLELSGEDSFTCSDRSLESQPNNSILRALFLFRQKTHLSFSVKIHLEKKIPMQAGLGGGSSNAATTLWGLNELCGKVLEERELCSLAKEIGSDVSFFFSKGSAYCTGRGENICNVSLPFPFAATLATPSFGMITPVVYRSVHLPLLSQENPENLLKSFWKDSPSYYNDLEIAAFSIEPRLLEVKRHLLEIGFEQVVMTGSGSSFFCLGKPIVGEVEGLVFHPVRACQREERQWYCST